MKISVLSWFRQRLPWGKEPTIEEPAQNRLLYLFLDEAGDLNFKPNGSKYFLFGSLVVRDPWPLNDALGTLRRQLFSGQFIPAAFHASEDRQATRDRVFECICAASDLAYDVTVVDKKLVPEEYREESAFYTFIADFTLRLTIAQYPTADPVYVTTDSLPLKKKRDAVVKGLKLCLSSVLGERRFQIEHHPSAAHGCLQAADYLNWAVYRKWEGGDRRSYDLVEQLIRRETQFDWKLMG